MLPALLDDENWFPVITPLALLVVIGFVVVARRRGIPARVITASAFNLFFGVWIGIMGAGHLFAVSTKAVLGILPPNIHLWIALPFGLTITVPGWLLTALVSGLMQERETAKRKAIWLNAWLAVVLIVPAWPLVIPPALNLLLLARKVRPGPRSLLPVQRMQRFGAGLVSVSKRHQGDSAATDRPNRR